MSVATESYQSTLRGHLDRGMSTCRKLDAIGELLIALPTGADLEGEKLAALGEALTGFATELSSSLADLYETARAEGSAQ
jgi:hypothetical protein